MIGRLDLKVRIFLSALNIDDIGKRWGIRITFVILVLVNFFLAFFPIGDSDFSAMESWYENYISNPTEVLMSDQLVLPFTTGNIIYLLVSLATVLFMVLVSIALAAIYIYISRPDKKEISKGKVVRRTITFMLFTIVVFPILLMIFGDSFIFLTAVMPIASLIMGAYVSGDYSFGRSFGYAFRSLRFSYLSGLFSYMIAYLIYHILRGCIDMLHLNNAYFTVVCILLAAQQTYLYLSVGKMAGTVYLDSKGVLLSKIGIKKI